MASTGARDIKSALTWVWRAMADSSTSRRKLFLHSAHPTIGVSSGGAVFQICQAVGRDEAPRSGDVVRLGLVAAAEDSGLLDTLEEFITENCTSVICCHARLTTSSEIPEIEDLDRFDCLVWLGASLKTSGQEVPPLWDWCRRGGGLIAIGPPVKILGSAPGMAGFGEAERRELIAVVPCALGHPLLTKVRAFGSSAVLPDPAWMDADALPVLLGVGATWNRPVAWARAVGRGRAVATTLGQPADIHQLDFLRFLANAVTWSAAS